MIAVETLTADIQAANGDKAKQAAAAQKALATWRSIYERGDFGHNSKILTAANIADGIFTSIALYYGAVPPAAPGAAKTVERAPTEAELNAQVERLRAAMQP